jgi:uncharacterized repeat protein (TIGR01451 family)
MTVIRQKGRAGVVQGLGTHEVWRHPVRLCCLLVALLAGIAALGTASASAMTVAHASSSSSACNDSAAGSAGLDANQLCWLDFAGLDPATAAGSGGQQLSVALPDGGTLSFTVTEDAQANLAPTSEPSNPAVWMGSAGYTGIAGEPRIYQQSLNERNTVTLSDISATTSTGAADSDFSLVAADAEETGPGESIDATTDGGAWSELPEPDDSPICGSESSSQLGLGAQTFSCTGTAETVSHALVAATSHPSTVTATLTGNGKEGIAFAYVDTANIPGDPQSGTDAYQETFENLTPGTADSVDGTDDQGGTTAACDSSTPAQCLAIYQGALAANTESYTADPYYSPSGDECNGIIASGNTPLTVLPSGFKTDCGGGWSALQDVATALGQFQGETGSAATANNALLEYTSASDPSGTAGTCAGGTGSDDCVEFATNADTIPVLNNHYYVASADYAAIDYQDDLTANCDNSDPKIDFNLTYPGGSNDVATDLDPCTAPGATIESAGTPSEKVVVAAVQSSADLWEHGTSMGLQQLNTDERGGSSGNDGATDDIQVIDATPVVSSDLASSTVDAGSVDDLTYTITNTSDLQAKDGWSFTGSLPSGLTIDGTPTTTCDDTAGNTAAGATLTPNGAGTSLAVSGSLDSGATSCTVTVPVTSATAASYSLTPSGLSSLTGLVGSDSGDVSAVTFQSADLAVTDTPSPSTGVPGTTEKYAVVVTNSGLVPAAGTTITDTLPAGETFDAADSSPSCSVSGQVVTCTVGAVAASGGSDGLTIAANISPSARGTITDPISVATSNPHSGATGASSTLTLSPASAVTVTDTATPSSVMPGQSAQYTVTAANAGPSDALNYTVTDSFGPGVAVTADTIPGGTCTISGSTSTGETVTCTVADLPVGTSVAADITATPQSDGTSLGNTVSATADDVSSAVMPTGGVPAVTTASVAGATDSVAVVTQGDGATATATATDPNDPSATVVSYSWNWGDGSATVTTSADTDAHTYPGPGTYTLTSTVTFSDGAVVTTTKTITIASPTGASASLGVATSGLTVTATATGTPADSAAQAVSYSWAWGDGSHTFTKTDKTSHDYTKPGTYTVTVKITYSDGEVTTVTKTVKVAARTYVLPFETSKFRTKTLDGFLAIHRRQLAWIDAHHAVQGWIKDWVPDRKTYVSRNFTLTVYVSNKKVATKTVPTKNNVELFYTVPVPKRVAFAKGTKVRIVGTYKAGGVRLATTSTIR